MHNARKCQPCIKYSYNNIKLFKVTLSLRARKAEGYKSKKIYMKNQGDHEGYVCQVIKTMQVRPGKPYILGHKDRISQVIKTMQIRPGKPADHIG